MVGKVHHTWLADEVHVDDVPGPFDKSQTFFLASAIWNWNGQVFPDLAEAADTSYVPIQSAQYNVTCSS